VRTSSRRVIGRRTEPRTVVVCPSGKRLYTCRAWPRCKPLRGLRPEHDARHRGRGTSALPAFCARKPRVEPDVTASARPPSDSPPACWSAHLDRRRRAADPALILIARVRPSIPIGSDVLIVSVLKLFGGRGYASRREVHWPTVGRLAAGSMCQRDGCGWTARGGSPGARPAGQTSGRRFVGGEPPRMAVPRCPAMARPRAAGTACSGWPRSSTHRDPTPRNSASRVAGSRPRFVGNTHDAGCCAPVWRPGAWPHRSGEGAMR